MSRFGPVGVGCFGPVCKVGRFGPIFRVGHFGLINLLWADFRGESFRPSWGGLFRPSLQGGSFRPDFQGGSFWPN